MIIIIIVIFLLGVFLSIYLNKNWKLLFKNKFANIINKIEIFHSFKIAKRIEERPQHKDKMVIELGINLVR